MGLELNDFTKLKYDRAVSFPRFISGEEAVDLYHELASRNNANLQYRLITDSHGLLFNGEKPSSHSELNLFGTISKTLKGDIGILSLNTFFRRGLEFRDKFSDLLIGLRTAYYTIGRQEKHLSLDSTEVTDFVKSILYTTKQYADDNFGESGKKSGISHIDANSKFK